jgi:hypothetical protein
MAATACIYARLASLGLITAFAAGSLSEARAATEPGTRVWQTSKATEIGSASGSVARESKLEWLLGKSGKFRLKVTSDGTDAVYLFNGKTLYLCGKLQPEAQKRLVGEGIAESVLKARFSKGACQAAPTNFLVRFTLSPQAAVESVDITDGLKLTLGIDDYATSKADGAAKSVAGKGCAGLRRTYLLTRSDAKGGRPDLSSNLAEQGCLADALLWRQDLASETAKMVLRQPGGVALAKLIRDEAAAQKGLPLEWSGSQITTAKATAGSKRSLSYELTTQAVDSVVLQSEDFALPSGFGVFSPETIGLFKSDGGSGAGGAPSKKPKDESLLDTMQSVFFCAIAGRFGCFAP